MTLLIKICGLKTSDALEVALDAGADMVGFVFFPPSPRHVGHHMARALGAQVRGRARKVALSVDATDADLAAAIEALEPDMLQLHGKETPERVASVRNRFGLPVMKALPISERSDLSPIRLYETVADRLIFDARPPRDATRPGGLGRSFDWHLLQGLYDRRSLYALGRPRCRECCGSVAHHPGARRRRLVRGRTRAGREGCGQDSRLHPGSARGHGAIRQPKNHEQRMTVQRQPNSFRTGPDDHGHFGIYGGRFVAETLMPLILDLERAYAEARQDPAFKKEMDGHLTHYVGRPSPLYFAERMTDHLREVSAAKGGAGGAKIYLKREDLNHTGAHKVNNVLGQILLARRMKKPRVIAETGAGMHGVATATLCAKFGLACIVYMGSVDVERQKPNVLRMKALGAEVRPVTSGSSTLKDAMNEALRDWVTNVTDTFYCIGTVAGPHPYPMMVRDFQSIIGIETRQQMQQAEGRLPNSLIACIGGGSNAMGLFHPFLDDTQIEIYGVEAAGRGSGDRPARRFDRRRAAGRAARQPHIPPDECRRPDQRGAFDLGRPRLSGHRARARVAQRHQARAIPLGDRRRGAGGVRVLLAARGHHPGARAGARAGAGDGSGAEEAEGSPDGGQSLRTRRQGPGERRRLSREADVMSAHRQHRRAFGRQSG